MAAPGFWDAPERAQKHIAKLNALKRIVAPVTGSVTVVLVPLSGPMFTRSVPPTVVPTCR